MSLRARKLRKLGGSPTASSAPPSETSKTGGGIGEKLLGKLTSIPTFQSLAVRDYRLLWLGQMSTSMGQWMDQVARGWLIYQITNSPLQLGLATAMRGLPMLFFGFIAGALADRSGRKAQLIIAQNVNSLLSFILATLVITGHVQPWHIYVTGFLAGTVQAFQQPARQTLVSDIVGNKNLMNALALNSAVVNGSRSIGPMVAGILIATIGVAGSYYTEAALYLFATVWTWQMRIPDRGPEFQRREREPFVRSIANGVSYVAKEPNIRMLMLLALIPVTLGMPYTSLIPVFARDVLHGGARLQGLILAMIGLGALMGALIVASMRREKGYAWTVMLGALVFGLALVGFSLSKWAALSCGLGIIIGVFNVTYQTQNQTLLQVLAPRRLRGRVMSMNLMSRALVPIGSLMAGALAEYFGAPHALLLMAGCSVISVIVIGICSPRFLHLEVPLRDDSNREIRGSMDRGAEAA